MPKQSRNWPCICLAIALLTAGQGLAQMTVTGTMSGVVSDPSGQVVAGAKITVTSDATGDVRSATSNEVGAFNVLALPPGSYSIKVEHSGFKSALRTSAVLSANEHLALGDIQLQIGAVTETVSVVAQGATVQTDSSEHSAVLTSNQLANLTTRGREVVSLLRTIPGVQYQADQNDVGGSFGTSSPNIGGAFNTTNVLAVDGVVSNDLGTPATFSSVTTLDAIGEVKVIMNSYQAEYASNGGAVIEVVTKSGGKEFHGSGYYYGRNEDLNANDFFNNRSVSSAFPNGIPRPEYRYNTLGATLGGPIYIPKKFNTSKNLLFGFYALENWSIRVPGALTQYTMPTALERVGDFTQSIAIKDPTTGILYPGNKVPASQLNANGLALLKTLPLPNFINPAVTGGNYNYQIQEVLKDPKRSQLFKIDIVPTDKDRFFVRGKTWLAQQQGYAVAAPAKPTGFFAQCYCFTESGLSVGWTHVFTPTIVMETTSGIRHNHEAWYPYGGQDDLNKVLRSAIGYTAGQWYPSSNPQGIIPRFTFGSPITNPPDVSFDDRFLTGGTDFTFSFNNNLTITRGPHTFKLGVSMYRLREYEGERSIFSGTFDFTRDTNNPFDTNYAFANAALGIFKSYTESNARYGANERQSLVDWFIQDTWKVNRKLTLDYGMRFSWYNQMYPNNAGQQSVLGLDLYKASQAPILFQPGFAPGTTTRVAVNPLTGATLPATYIGAFVPGTGNPAPGGVLAGDNSYPRGFIDQQPVLYGPRLGFAYDPFGRGKTAIRGGASILYNTRLTKWSQTTENPPAIFTPITYYGNMNTFLQTAGVLSPSNTNAYNRQNKTPSVYNITFGIQQDLGHSTLLDASYLATLGRHIPQTVALNTIPYGSRFLTQNLDPTTGKVLPDNFFRPLPGYNNVTLTDNAYTSNYHALLLSLNRRFAKGLQFGLAYTYSKFMDQGTNGTQTTMPVYRPLRTWSYGLDTSDQTHNVTINFTYAIPVGEYLSSKRLVRYTLGGWQLSGIAQFVSGTPAFVTFTTTDSTDLTGGGDGQRVNVVGDANSVSSSFYQWFNQAAFARPGKNDPGNAGKFALRNPGVNNFDLALAKQFPLKSEKQYVQLRWEAYNAFNHTQYATLDTAAKFDPNGVQTNTRFGQVISTRTPRVMQGSLRFVF
jgi:hypothetical protein